LFCACTANGVAIKVKASVPASSDKVFSFIITLWLFVVICRYFGFVCSYDINFYPEINLELTTTLATLKLIIQDNGKGFDLGQNPTGFGLQSMRDRILALGREFEINTHPGAGCQIIVQVPLLKY
jgi:two-component sensor histidine kinase